MGHQFLHDLKLKFKNLNLELNLEGIRPLLIVPDTYFTRIIHPDCILLLIHLRNSGIYIEK